MANMVWDFEDVAYYERLQRERDSIETVIGAKQPTLEMIRESSKPKFPEIVEGMYNQTSNVLPEALDGALKGKTADAASKFLKDIPRVDLQTPVKGA